MRGTIKVLQLHIFKWARVDTILASNPVPTETAREGHNTIPLAEWGVLENQGLL